MQLKRAPGFTIVELVVVVLLLGVLSVTAMSRFVEPSAFAPSTVSSVVMAQGHYAAQSAQTSAASITLSVAGVGNTWQADVSDGALSLRSVSVDVANTQIEIANGASVYDLAAVTPLDLVFAGDGDLQSAMAGANVLNVDLGTELRIIGDTTRVLCFYPTGYASARAC